MRLLRYRRPWRARQRRGRPWWRLPCSSCPSDPRRPRTARSRRLPRQYRSVRRPGRRCADRCGARSGGEPRAHGCESGSTWRGAGGNRSCSSYYSRKRIDRLGLLGFLQDDLLARIADALALVGLRRTERTDLRRRLTDELLVSALDQDFGLRRDFDGDAFRRLEDHRVREAERQIDGLAGKLCAVTHADQLELLLETGGDALDHIGDDGASRATELVVGAFSENHRRDAVVLLERHARQFMGRQRALRALDGDGTVGDRDLDALRQIDRQLGYT